ncbi:MAG: glycosyltransferase [Planctomycetia bacterium]
MSRLKTLAPLDDHEPIGWWEPMPWQRWATNPRKILRGLQHAPVSVRIAGPADRDGCAGLSTRWTFDRRRHGPRVLITFSEFSHLASLTARWRILADAIWEIGRDDSSFSFHDAVISLADGVGSETPAAEHTFAKRPGSPARLIPNPYLLRPRPWLTPPLPWALKTNTLYFRGSSTGPQSIEANLRATLCHLAKTLPHTDCRLSRLGNSSPAFARELKQHGLVGGRHPIDMLNLHRFLADVDGHGSSWDRFLLIGSFGGVPIRFEPQWEECWHPLLADGHNCVVADRHTLADVLERLRSHPAEARRIASNARDLVRTHLSRPALRRMLAETLRTTGLRACR